MAETIYHAPDDRGLTFKYLLRLLTVEQARQFETHLAGCDHCASQLAEITHFFELLRKALSPKPVVHTQEAPTDKASAPSAASSSTLGDLFQPPPDFDIEKLVTVFANCFAGFQKLRRNIAARIGHKVEMAQIDQAAIEILLALPNQVSKIEDQS